MKHTPYLFCLLVLSLPAFSQIPKGTATIGGSASISYQETKTQSFDKLKQTTFNLQPDYGLFLINNLCVGASIWTTFTRSGGGPKFNNQELNSKGRSLSVGPFVRYYLPINPKLYAFARANYAFQWNKVESEIYVSDFQTVYPVRAKYNANTWGAGAGLSYFMNPHIAVEGTLGYSSHKLKPADVQGALNTYESQKTGTLALGIGLRIFLRKAN